MKDFLIFLCGYTGLISWDYIVDFCNKGDVVYGAIAATSLLLLSFAFCAQCGKNAHKAALFEDLMVDYMGLKKQKDER